MVIDPAKTVPRPGYWMETRLTENYGTGNADQMSKTTIHHSRKKQMEVENPDTLTAGGKHPVECLEEKNICGYEEGDRRTVELRAG